MHLHSGTYESPRELWTRKGRQKPSVERVASSVKLFAFSLYQLQYCIALQILMGILLPISATALKMACHVKMYAVITITSAVYL
jgi:hypothetical protein